MPQDLRTYLNVLQREGELITVNKEVDPLTQIGTLLWQSDRAILFTNIKGYPRWRITGQIAKTRRQIATALNTTPEEAVIEAMKRIEAGPVRCKLVSDGPVKDEVLLEDRVDLNKIPVTVSSEGDRARFITAGLCIVKDPETGRRNMAFHRLQVKSRNHTGILMVPRHTWMIYEKYRSLNKPMAMAVAIGHHPAYEIAGAYCGPLGLDELELAGALLQEPPELVRCETIDLEAPARAEIILEGEIPPDVREDEGPFGEFQGYLLTGKGMNPVFRVKAITMRRDAIYRHVQAGRPPTEHQTLVGFPMEIAVYGHVKDVEGFIDLKDVHVPAHGGCFMVILQLTPHYEGQAKNALMAALSGPYLHPKIAIAVDEDVDIHDPGDVHWAVSTRVNPAKDIFIIEGTRNHPMDPSLPLISPPGTRWQRVGSKMGIDATKPSTSRPEERAMMRRIRPMGWGKYALKDFV
ncbi:MAG: UbiD family decarboxylase [Candidatus Bathyarchaeia archaeon]